MRRRDQEVHDNAEHNETDTRRARFVTVPWWAGANGLTRGRVWQMCRDGFLPAIQSGRRYLIDTEAVDRLATEQAAERRKASGGGR